MDILVSKQVAAEVLRHHVPVFGYPRSTHGKCSIPRNTQMSGAGQGDKPHLRIAMHPDSGIVEATHPLGNKVEIAAGN